MKKTLLIALMALVSVASYAQSPWSYNVKAGLNMSSMSNIDGSKMKMGFNVGVGAEYAFNETWAIQPSLLLTTKGVKVESDGDKATYNPMYLEIPVMGAARFPIAENTNLVISTGPYFAFGIGGKATAEYEGEKEKADIFNKDGIDANAFDLGWGAGITVEFGKFFAGLNGEFSFTKFVDADEQAPKSTNFSIGIGYKF